MSNSFDEIREQTKREQQEKDKRERERKEQERQQQAAYTKFIQNSSQYAKMLNEILNEFGFGFACCGKKESYTVQPFNTHQSTGRYIVTVKTIIPDLKKDSLSETFYIEIRRNSNGELVGFAIGRSYLVLRGSGDNADYVTEYYPDSELPIIQGNLSCLTESFAL